MRIRKYKNLVIVLGVLILFSLFSGCHFDISSKDDRLADDLCKQILNSFEEKDSKDLKALFSTAALNDAVGFDEGFSYVTSIYQGKFVSLEKKDMYTHEIVGSQKEKKISPCYEIVTDKNVYMMLFDYWVENENTPDLVGLYRIKIVTKDVFDQANFTWDIKANQAGLYYPLDDE